MRQKAKVGPTHTIFFTISSSGHQMSYASAEIFPYTATHPMNQDSQMRLYILTYNFETIHIIPCSKSLQADKKQYT